MTRDEARRIAERAASPARAAALIRAKLRREDRQAARKAKRSAAQWQRERFHESVEQSFKIMQAHIVPNVLRVREP